MKQKIFYSLATLSFLLNLNTVAEEAKHHVKYFTKIVGIISPFLDYQLTGSIEVSRANTLNHYKVLYDEQNRVSEISYFHGKHPNEASYFYTHKMTYSYEGDVTTRRYFDKTGQPASMSRHYYQGGEIHREVLTRTEDQIELRLFNITGQPVSTGLGAYKFVKTPFKENGFIQTQFDEHNNPVVLTNYFPFEKSLITKDQYGYLEKIINLNSESEKIENHQVAKFSHVIFDFDEFGNEMGWKFLNTEGELVNRPDSIESPGYAVWVYDFDWRDRSIGKFHSFEMSYFDKDGNRFCDSNAICKTRFENDSYGEYSAQSFHKADGSLISDTELNFARIEIARDEYGRRIEYRYLNNQGELRKTGTAIRVFSYDNDGNETITNFDSSNNPIQQEPSE